MAHSRASESKDPITITPQGAVSPQDTVSPQITDSPQKSDEPLTQLSQPEGEIALTLPREALIKTISYEYYVSLQIHKGRKIHFASKEHRSYKCFFQSENWDQQKIEHYLNKLMSTCGFESELFVLMTLVMDRFFEKNPFLFLCDNNFRALILSSLSITQKFLDDESLIVSDVAKVGEMSLARLLKLERKLFKGIEYEVPFQRYEERVNQLLQLTEKWASMHSSSSSSKKSDSSARQYNYFFPAVDTKKTEPSINTEKRKTSCRCTIL